MMGSKTAARRGGRSPPACRSCPALDERVRGRGRRRRIADAARAIGYPLMVKAVAGGGGKGMRVVSAPDELPGAVRAARSEARRVVRRRRDLPRAAPRSRPATSRCSCSPMRYGTVLPFVERECSIQRRHQKVVEETPSAVVSPSLRAALLTAAAAAGRATVGYVNAGTIEFLLDEAGALLLPRDEHAAAGRASDHRDW